MYLKSVEAKVKQGRMLDENLVLIEKEWKAPC